MAGKQGFIKTLAKASLGITGIRLLDPVEIFYIKESNLIIPIISKSACTTIKEGIIERYKPGFESKFPEIHKINPSKVTEGKVDRMFFYRFSHFEAFAKNKKVLLILREPASRFISCYKDVTSGNNIMYEYPSGLYKWIKYEKNISFSEFSKRVYRTPDYLSDRHFRSQSFGLSKKLIDSLEEFDVSSVEDFFSQSELLSKAYKEGRRVLNQSKGGNYDIPTLAELRESTPFKKRYALDLELCEVHDIQS